MKIPAPKPTPRRYLEHYLNWDITDLALILYTLQFPIDVLDEAFKAFPNEVMEKFEEFIDTYTPETLIINGDYPPAESITFAREWLAKKRGAK